MKFRKKPVVIEAMQLGNASFLDIIGWAGGGAIKSAQVTKIDGRITSAVLKIKTPEGCLDAKFGDWIIKDINGEFYPCKPEIFAKTYELAEPTT